MQSVNDTSTASVSAGDLRGTSAYGINRFLGIPYAAAPVGKNRFALAQPHPGWQGERDATVMGATAPQNPYSGVFGTLLPTVVVPGDEYLNVNIWAPADAENLPVVVWVHGGALSRGTNALAGYDGTSFARDGLVFVSINYRLGVEGFSVLDDAPLNLGVEDTAAALRWVKAEIHNFGGDPENVTAFGQSAGAIVLGALVASPGARSLFKRAILQSGAPAASSRKTAGKITGLEAKKVGIKPTRKDFAATAVEKFLAAETEIMAGRTPITGGPGYAIAVGSDLVPVDPQKAIVAGAGNDIELMLGNTSEEANFWFVPLGLKDSMKSSFFTLVRLRFGITPKVLRAYKKETTDHRPGALFGTFATDLIVRLPFNRIADARLKSGVATYLYEFTWPTPVLQMGAAHAIELGFVFDVVNHPDWVALGGENAPQQLADDMHSAWVSFAKTGDPGWESWSARRPVQTFDAPASRVVYAPHEETRAVWGK